MPNHSYHASIADRPEPARRLRHRLRRGRHHGCEPQAQPLAARREPRARAAARRASASRCSSARAVASRRHRSPARSPGRCARRSPRWSARSAKPAGSNRRRADRGFRLGLREALEPSVLPRLGRALCAAGPKLTLATARHDRPRLEQDLAAGEFDVALDVLLPIADRVPHERVLVDRLIVVARKDHPALRQALRRGAWNLDAYLALEHVQVSSRRRGPTLEDMALRPLGRTRRVRVRCQSHAAACAHRGRHRPRRDHSRGVRAARDRPGRASRAAAAARRLRARNLHVLVGERRGRRREPLAARAGASRAAQAAALSICLERCTGSVVQLAREDLAAAPIHHQVASRFEASRPSTSTMRSFTSISVTRIPVEVTRRSLSVSLRYLSAEGALLATAESCCCGTSASASCCASTGSEHMPIRPAATMHVSPSAMPGLRTARGVVESSS